MAEQPVVTHPLLQRPLCIFSLPQEILDSLAVRTDPKSSDETEDQVHSAGGSHTPNLTEDGISLATSCGLCGNRFNSVQQQRQHVKSDFHRYNLKLQAKQQPPVDEQTFIRLIGDLDESISGSGSSESEDDDEQGNSVNSTLTALLRKKAKISQTTDADAVTSNHVVAKPRSPFIWLSSSKLDATIGLGLYKAILSENEQQELLSGEINVIKRRQLSPASGKQSGVKQQTMSSTSDPHVFLCMTGGGHFAAMIVSLVPEIRRGQGGVEERHPIVVAHKTFHRYTTRRKQGGSQSANDNSKGNAHSAGSSIRRYNEAALEVDIRTLLNDWKPMIDSAELLFVRATGKSNRKTIFGPYDGQVVYNNDKRLRGFPFNTRRPTQGELLRSFQELTRLKVKEFKPAPDPLPTNTSTTITKSQAKPKEEPPKPSKEEEALLLHTSQLQNLIRRSKAPGVLLYLTKNDLSPNFPFYPPSENHHAPTPLHLSASSNSPALVLALLTKAKADPTLKNGDGKTPYEISGDTKTRESFRIARHELGESYTDWTLGHVPSALSPEEAEFRATKEKQQADAAEAERRKNDLEKLRQEEENRNVNRIEKKAGVGKSIASQQAEKTGAEKREEEARGLTPEMRMRLERERRARAAEERIKRMQAGSK